jgi:hypothetical protein
MGRNGNGQLKKKGKKTRIFRGKKWKRFRRKEKGCSRIVPLRSQ